MAIDGSGHVVTLTGRERVRQAMLKGILTVRRDGYGSNAATLIGESAPSVNEVVAGSVQTFVDEYRDAQPADLPAEEIIESINTLQVLLDAGGQTLQRINLVLNMADGQSIEIDHRF